MIDKTDKSLIAKLVETYEQHRQEQRAKHTTLLSSGDTGSSAPGWRWLLPTPGNVIFTLLVVAALFWAQSAGAIQLGAPAATSTGTIAYQGRLADSGGAPLTGTYNMIFRLYTATSGGTPLWEEQWTGSNSVQVSDGLFNVMLGSLTSIPQSIVTGNPNLFLGITVGTDGEMNPRVQLGNVPFAVQALTVPDGSITAAKLASDVSLVPLDGSITTVKIADDAVTQAKLATNLFELKRASTTTTNWQLPSCGGSNNFHAIPGLALNFNLNEPKTILVGFTGIGANPTSTGSVWANIHVDGAFSTVASGVADNSGCRNSSTDSGYAWCTLSSTSAISLTAGSHTIDVRAMCDPGGPASVYSGSMWALTLP